MVQVIRGRNGLDLYPGGTPPEPDYWSPAGWQPAARDDDYEILVVRQGAADEACYYRWLNADGEWACRVVRLTRRPKPRSDWDLGKSERDRLKRKAWMDAHPERQWVDRPYEKPRRDGHF